MAQSPKTLLKTYRQKRDFTKTAEPSGEAATRKPAAKKAKALTFVVQKHDATRLHYDFRLELDGVLKSWAVTKGPSTNPADKRLAVHVEDHPLDYGGFEGTIPAGEYGGGTVMLWDEGTWEPIGDPHDGLAKGDLKFRLFGKRMKGEWVLVHMKGRDAKTRNGLRENWLLIKHHDDYATDHDTLTEDFTTSVETGRDLAGIAKGNKSRKKAAPLDVPVRVWTREGEQKLPTFRAPQLATLVEAPPEGDQWLIEMKYDGYRAIAAVTADQVRIYTRNGNDWTVQFAPLAKPLSRLTKGSVLLDGEIVAFKDGRTDFSTLKEALSTGAPLTYLVFDILEQDGDDLTRLSQLERKSRLEAFLATTKRDPAIQFSPHVVGNAAAVFEKMCETGQEGIVAKLASAPYRSERTKAWLKIKCGHRQEFIIGGWRPSDKTKGFDFASLLLGAWENGTLVYHGRVGTGWDEKVAKNIQASLDKLARDTPAFAEVPRDIRRQARWVEPKLVAEIAYTEMTPDGSLRHPSFLGLREDKSSREVKMETPQSPPPEAKARKAAAKAAPAKSPAAPRAAKKPKKIAPIEITDDMGIAAAEALGVKLTHPNRALYPKDGVTKAQLVAYYGLVHERMLAHTANRPLSLVRTPQGQGGQTFFQKHDSGGFPENFKKIPIHEKDGTTEDYLYIDGPGGLAAGVQMSTLEFHIWGSHIDTLEKPDRIIFDIDPDEGLDFAITKQAAVDFRTYLRDLGLETFAMVTGGKGIHVIAPLKPTLDWPEVKAFCRGFAEMVARKEPDRFTDNIRKVQRKGRMFVDYLRNERGSTAVSPFSTRAKPGAPCAVPVGWDELDGLPAANIFSIGAAAARAQAPDPWPDYFKLKQAITAKMLKAVGA